MSDFKSMRWFRTALVLGMIFQFLGCAGESTYNDRGSKIEKDDGEIRIQRNESLSTGEDQRQITISMQDEDTGALALSSDSQVDGLQGFVECDDGIKELVMRQRVTLSGSPKNCLFKLVAITRAGFIYLPKSTAPFTSYAVGDTGVFISPNGGEMKFTIVQQLPSPLVANAMVSMKFIEVSTGSSLDTSSDVKMNTGSVSSTGDAAPQLIMKSFEINPVNSLQTNAIARFECLVPMKGNSDSTYTCNGDSISSLRHWVGPAPELFNISVSFFDSAFGNSKTVSALTPAAVYLPAGTPGLLNGGFELTYQIGSAGMIKSLQDFADSGMVFAFGQAQTSSYVYSIGHLAEVHIVSIAQAASNSGDRVPVKVNTQRPTVLALSSSSKVNWDITLAPGANIPRVILYGKEKATITGLPVETVIETYCASGCQNPLRAEMFKDSWLIVHPSLESAQFMIFVRSLTNLEVSSVQAANSALAEGFTIPKK
jgi:hypothetical protein